MKRRLLFFFIAIVFFIVVIQYLRHEDSTHRVNIKLNRFEQALFSIDSDNVLEKSSRWDQEFGTFNNVFPELIQISSSDQNIYCDNLLAFTQDKDMREAYDSTAKLFFDFSDIQNDLELAFGQVHIAFPSYPIPEVTTFFGGFHYGVIAYENNIGIGLDWFLGENSKYYDYLRDPKYLRYQKQKRFILPNVMEVWFNQYFQDYLVDRDLLSQIIYKGKMMYFLDKMLPNFALQDKFRFTAEQMRWVEENELHIWNYFIHEDLLFSKNLNEFRSFIEYAPFAKGMPKDAPGRVGYFIGYRIVSSYMDKNNVDMQDLMLLKDSKKILKQSEYNPKK